MKHSLVRVTLGVLTALVLLSTVWSSAPAMFAPNQKWVRTRQDDELIGAALASKWKNIGVVYLAQNAHGVDALIQKVRALGGSVSHVDRRVGYFRASVPANAIYTALDVPPGDVASVNVDVDAFKAPPAHPSWEPPAKNQSQYLAETKTQATRDFMRAPSPILHDLGADVWRNQHPAFDGRGVVIADVENILDPMVPELSGALTLDGKPIRKIEGIHLNVGPNDRSNSGDNALQWVSMRTSVSGSTATYAGSTYRLPHAGNFRIGMFDLKKAASITHWLNPVLLEPYIGDGRYAVLWEPSSGLVWVDRNRSRDFRSQRAMRDYNVAGDYSYFGSLQPSKTYPLIIPAVSYMILEDRPDNAVAVALGIGTHANGVSDSAAGHAVGPNDPVHGVAPAAQVASFEYDCSRLDTQAESMIAAAEDPKVDDIVWEICSGIHTNNEEGWFLAALDERLVQVFNKPIFVPGSNEPAIAAIDDAGIGKDVVAVGGSQSAESYWRYAGFRPSVAIHKHWGGLTDGPGQDGRLKPDLLAPSGYVSAEQKYSWTPLEQRKEGFYTLPAGFWSFGGTSQATPTAGGAAALLLSAIKQSHLHLSAIQLVNAMRLGATLSPSLYAHEEGNGLINIAASWRILQQQARGTQVSTTQAAPCGGSVRTGLWPGGAPSGGKGILETIGWHPGDRGSRTIRFCLPPNTGAIHASLLRNDGTFSLQGMQRSGATATVRIGIAPRTPTFHSTLVQLADSSGRVIGRSMASVAAAVPLIARNKYSATSDVLVPRPGYAATFADVPPNSDALLISVNRDSPVSISIQDPSGMEYEHVPFSWTGSTHQSITIPAPMSGAWEVIVEDVHDVFSNERHLLPVNASSAKVTFQAVRVDNNGKNEYAATPIHSVGAVQTLATQSGTFTSQAPVIVPIDVPKDTDAVMVDLRGSDGRVDGYLMRCEKLGCAPAARVLGGESDKTLTEPNVAAGHYVVVLDDFTPAKPGGALPAYRLKVFAYTHLTATENQSANRAYEVNCDPPGSTVSAAPSCGLFIKAGE